MVTLTPSELEVAAIIAVKRQAENLCAAGRSNRYGAQQDGGWSLHIEGACGEMAVAKWRGIFWSGNVGNLQADDVGRAQVRTRSRHDYELIIHKDDRDDRAFILVTGLAPQFVLRGWIYGHAGKNPEWWRDPAGGRPAFFVPQSALRPMRGGKPESDTVEGNT